MGRPAQNVAHRHELRLAIDNHAGVRRNRELTVAERKQGISCGLRIGPSRQVHEDVGIGRSVVLDPCDLDLALVRRSDDRIHQRASGGAKGNFGDPQNAFFVGGDPRAHPHLAAAQSVAVIRRIHDAARREIRQQVHRFIAQHGDRRLDELIEIVRQHLTGKPDGNALDPLREKKRKFHRQGVRLLATTIVTRQPTRGLGVKDNIERKFREARFNVSRGRRSITGEGIAPVTLGVDEQVLLPELHDRRTDRLITMRVIIHRVAHDPGDLVVAAIIELLHRMKDPALHGLEAVIQMRHCPLKNHIAGVIKKVVGIHPAERCMLVRIKGHRAQIHTDQAAGAQARPRITKKPRTELPRPRLAQIYEAHSVGGGGGPSPLAGPPGGRRPPCLILFIISAR